MKKTSLVHCVAVTTTLRNTEVSVSIEPARIEEGDAGIDGATDAPVDAGVLNRWMLRLTAAARLCHLVRRAAVLRRGVVQAEAPPYYVCWLSCL